MIRDSQKSALYASETLLSGLFDRCLKYDNPTVEVEGVTLDLPPEGKFADIASLQTYCDKVCKLMKVEAVHVEAHRNQHGNAFYQSAGRRIVIPDGQNRWALRELVVLHELAHHVTWVQNLDAAAHGPEFVANYITMLERVMAPQAGLAARLVYAANGVKEGAQK
jgi:putative metallohydrolase (TIGR04338 family)